MKTARRKEKNPFLQKKKKNLKLYTMTELWEELELISLLIFWVQWAALDAHINPNLIPQFMES